MPPPVQSALLAAIEQSERRYQSLEEQFLQLKERLTEQDEPASSRSLELPDPAPPMRETKLSRHRHRRHHRSPQEKRERWREKLLHVAKRYLLWPLLVVAVVLASWALINAISPGKALPVPQRK